MPAPPKMDKMKDLVYVTRVLIETFGVQQPLGMSSVL